MVQGSMTLDPPAVLIMVKEKLQGKRKDDKSHTLQMIVEKDVQCGEGRKAELRDPGRRITNQLLMNTISRHTLRWILQRRGEQIWTSSFYDDPDSRPK